MDSAAVGAACDLMLLAGCFATLAGLVIGLIIGYLKWGCQTTLARDLETGLSREQVDDSAQKPLDWQHFIKSEQEEWQRLSSLD